MKHQTKSGLELIDAISPFKEMIAYETLWGQQGQSLRTLADLFKAQPRLPSELLATVSDEAVVRHIQPQVIKYLSSKRGFSVALHGAFQYPERLQEAKHPVELFYYQGDISFLESRCVSVVGSRKCSEVGKSIARDVASALVSLDFTIVSGLALGIDTAALTGALEQGGRVVGVIGTPIDQFYPPENAALQRRISEEQLLISQVPFYRYSVEPFKAKRNYFPQRNETMSALSEATIIVEASDTSGTLTQARAALQQGRKLLVMDSCFDNPNISWPAKFEQKGAVRIREIEDIIRELGANADA